MYHHTTIPNTFHDQELKEHEKDVQCAEVQSSLLWICTTEHNSSQVSVVDANNPADILDAFHVTSSHILCITSVPGTATSLQHFIVMLN